MRHELTQDEKLALERFPLVAQEFCQFVEQTDLDQREPFIRQLFVQLARVCEAANRLPWVGPTDRDIETDQDDIRAHTDQCFKLSEKLRKIFGSLDSYWDVFDPTQKEEPVNGSLARDIAEICMDLKDAQDLLGSGIDLNDVYWQWRLDFRSHWGRHAGSALKVLLLNAELP
jgi:hypothetical protein